MASYETGNNAIGALRPRENVLLGIVRSPVNLSTDRVSLGTSCLVELG